MAAFGAFRELQRLVSDLQQEGHDMHYVLRTKFPDVMDELSL